MSWRKSFIGGVLVSAMAVVACGGGGEQSGDDASRRNPSTEEPPISAPDTQSTCTWTLTRAGGTVTGSCLGALAYDPARPLSTVRITISSSAVATVKLMLPQELTPGSYSFGNSPLIGSVSVTDSTGVYYADRSPGTAVQGAVTYDVLSVDNTSAGTVLQGRIQAEAVQAPWLQNRAQLTVEFSGLLR